MANHIPEHYEVKIPKHLKKLWEAWDIRVCVFLSLFLQTFLILFAPLRKKTSSAYIITLLWSAYLLADTVAIFAVGKISSNENKFLRESEGKNTSKSTSYNGDLLAFWAPFLLVHLGGPDTITAFALEDNELWLRHLFGLLTELFAAAYVFFQSLPKNVLCIPTLLMFLTGIIKYAERTRSLYLASANSFRGSMLTEPDPGPNYAKLMDEYYAKKEANLPTRIEMLPEPDRVVKASDKEQNVTLKDLQVVQYAYRYFMTFRGLIVDLIFSFRERNQSRDFFLARTAQDAFRLVEVELNFMYEVLFTKLPVVYDYKGYCGRIISSVAVIISLVLFHTNEKKGFQKFDIVVTYTLLSGAITLDVIAFVMLVFSDWTVVMLKPSPDERPDESSKISKFLFRLLEIKTKRTSLKSIPFIGVLLGIMERRWAESVSQYNLIYYCLHKRRKRWEKFYDYFGLTSTLDECWYVERKSFNVFSRDFIFDELKEKSEMADDLETAKEICSAKGEWVLRIGGFTELLPYVTDVDYDQSLLLWHIATELCYETDGHPSPEISNNTESNQPNPEGGNNRQSDYRDFAKMISDYMIYLLVMQPNMMSAVSGIGLIRFRDTCAEATKFFSSRKLVRKKLGAHFWECRKKSPKDLQRSACENILAVNTEVKPVTVKGDRSKSVFFDGSILAKELKEKENKWLIMSKVWVELLSYAATHVRSRSHAQQLSKGGELITIVWLLMAHFGLGEQFQINEGHARAKLIVGK